MPRQVPHTTAFRAEDLPSPQRLALEALLQGMSKAEAAQHARTSERTLRRWLRDPHFVAALRQARCDAWLETTTALQRLNRNALAALQRVLDSDNPRAQVDAAKVVFGLTVKALDVEAMCGRIAQAEADLEAHLNGGTKPTFYSDPEDEDRNEDPGSASAPTVPAQAGTPQGDGSGGIHPVAALEPAPDNATPHHGGGPFPEVNSTTVRECPPHSEPAPAPARTGQTRPYLAADRLDGDSPRSQGVLPETGHGYPCSANGATSYQPGATPSEPGTGAARIHPVAELASISDTANPSQGRGPATGQLPSRDPRISAHEGDRHAPENSGALNEQIGSRNGFDRRPSALADPAMDLRDSRSCSSAGFMAGTNLPSGNPRLAMTGETD